MGDIGNRLVLETPFVDHKSREDSLFVGVAVLTKVFTMVVAVTIMLC